MELMELSPMVRVHACDPEVKEVKFSTHRPLLAHPVYDTGALSRLDCDIIHC